jgi:hypothetical protein
VFFKFQIYYYLFKYNVKKNQKGCELKQKRRQLYRSMERSNKEKRTMRTRKLG